MKVIHPGRQYQLEDGNNTKLTFTHYDERLRVRIEGVTSCDMLAVLIHRRAHLNQGDGYCVENIEALHGLYQAINALKAWHDRVAREAAK